MEKISEFRIAGMTLSGFKSFDQPTELTFGEQTVVTGGNGRGKSSIADAIAFAITGFPFFGERGNDRLVSERSDALSIELRFTDQNGTFHTLLRKWDKAQTSITYDGAPIRQSALTELFGEKDVFLSIFNPLYFIEELGESGKNLLERYLPTIPKEEVLPMLSDQTRSALDGEDFVSPEAYLKKLRSDTKELENSLIYLQGQKDLAETQASESAETEARLLETVSTLTAERDALEAKRFEGRDVSAMRSHMADLSAQYSDLAPDRGAGDAQARILDLTARLSERRASAYEPKYAGHIAETAERVRCLSEQYQREKQTFTEIARNRVCPTCRRDVTERDLPALREAYQRVTGAVIKEGKSEQEKLAELKELEQKAHDTFEQFKAEDIARLEAELRTANEEKQEGDCAQRRSELRLAIQELTTALEYGNLSGEEYDRLRECSEALRQAETELSAIRSLAKQDGTSFNEKIEAVNRKIRENSDKIKHIALFISKKMELLTGRLEMNCVKISLFDVVKSTGEVKDAFKFTYNGRRYDRLSLSEKVRAGMELSELVKRLTGRNYPVFVDNMESIEDLKNVQPTGQVFMANCVKRSDLSVRVLRPIVPELENAA